MLGQTLQAATLIDADVRVEARGTISILWKGRTTTRTAPVCHRNFFNLREITGSDDNNDTPHGCYHLLGHVDRERPMYRAAAVVMCMAAIIPLAT